MHHPHTSRVVSLSAERIRRRRYKPAPVDLSRTHMKANALWRTVQPWANDLAKVFVCVLIVYVYWVISPQ